MPRFLFDDDAGLRSYQGLTEFPESLPHPRRKRGIRHRAAVVLAVAVAVVMVMAGADSVTVVAEWASDVPPEVLAALGARCDRRRGRRSGGCCGDWTARRWQPRSAPG